MFSPRGKLVSSVMLQSCISGSYIDVSHIGFSATESVVGSGSATGGIIHTSGKTLFFTTSSGQDSITV